MKTCFPLNFIIRWFREKFHEKPVQKAFASIQKHDKINKYVSCLGREFEYFEYYVNSQRCTSMKQLVLVQKLERYIREELSVLTGETCQLLVDTVQWNYFGRSFDVVDILRIAETLMGDSPGWKVLAAIAKSFKFVKMYDFREAEAVGHLIRLRDRTVHGDFSADTLPHVCVVWILCRLHTYTPPTEALTFPPEWKEIMKTQTRLDTGLVDMIFTKCTAAQTVA